MAPAGAFAAKFVEVRVDPDLGLVRVARVVSAIDGGRILNEKTATQPDHRRHRWRHRHGAAGGDRHRPGTGRIANATFGDYLVPVNADVPDIDVIFVGEPDPFNPIGVKGVGEVGSSASPPPSPTPSSTPPAGGSAPCRSPSTSSCDV